MDNESLKQFLNEQNLVNMSIIEQLNKQADYLNSVMERLEIIYSYIDQNSNSNGNNNMQTNNQVTQPNPMASEEQNNPQVDLTPQEEAIVEEERDVNFSVNGSDEMELVTHEVNRYIVFGDRIKVISRNNENTGVFIELDHQFLVWVIDEGKLTFTDIVGATIIKLT